MNSIRVALAIAWMDHCFDMKLTEAQRRERIAEVLAILEGIGAD